jgi:hypothetical protein
LQQNCLAEINVSFCVNLRCPKEESVMVKADEERPNMRTWGFLTFISISCGLAVTICTVITSYQLVFCGLNMQLRWEKQEMLPQIWLTTWKIETEMSNIKVDLCEVGCGDMSPLLTMCNCPD